MVYYLCRLEARIEYLQKETAVLVEEPASVDDNGPVDDSEVTKNDRDRNIPGLDLLQLSLLRAGAWSGMEEPESYSLLREVSRNFRFSGFHSLARAAPARSGIRRRTRLHV